MEGKLNNKKVLKFLIFSDLHLHIWSKFETRISTAIRVLDIISSEV